MDDRWIVVAALVAAAVGLAAQGTGRATADVRLMTVDPGHFHAALIHKEMYPGVAARVDIYAPEGWDLAEHLKRVTAFKQPARPADLVGGRDPHQR